MKISINAMMEKLNCTREQFEIIKAYLQIQILLETLDDVLYDSKMLLKQETKKYLNVLKIKAEPIIKTMFDSNESFFMKLTNETRENINNIEKYFNIQ